MSKGFLGVIVLVVLIFVGIFAFSGNKSDSGSSKGSGNATTTHHIEGQGKSGVTLVEYGDYECPFCGQAYPVVKKVQADLNDQIFFQFRNYPLVSLHKNAFAGARAAEAAAMQNKFWQMHDTLYENQDPNGKVGWVASGDPLNEYFVGFAKQLGLDINKFKTDYNSGKVNDLINADMAEGNKLKIQGTPTFFLDGKQIDISYTSGPSAAEKIINDAIAKKTKSQTGQ